MQHQKRLLRGLVSLRKDNTAETFKGEFELYEDHVILRISDKFSFSSIARSLPPHLSGGGIERVHSIFAYHQP
jgi:hypothetical protein